MNHTGRLKIVIVSSSFPPFSSGGISSSHFNLYNLLKTRYQVEVFTFEDSSVKKVSEDAVHRYGLPDILNKIITFCTFLFLRATGSSGVMFQAGEVLCGAFAGLYMLRHIKKYEPDIIIVPDHGAVSAFWPKLMKAKIVFISHHNSMRFCNVPLLGNISVRDAEIARKFEQRAINKADQVICPSQYMKEIFQKTYSFESNITVIPNMIDADCFSKVIPSNLRCQMGLSDETPMVYIPSAGSIFKGSRFVFEIIRRISSGYAKEIGFYLSGSINKELMGCFGALPENAKLFAPGAVPYNNNIANIKACSLCISPTIAESFGMALLEAQWSGIPVVAFDVGGNKDVVVHGTTGYLVPFSDLESLIELSLGLLLAPLRLNEMSSAAKNITRQNFEASILLDKYEKLFVDMMPSGSVENMN